MKLFVASVLAIGLVFVCSRSWAQFNRGLEGPESETQEDIETGNSQGTDIGNSQGTENSNFRNSERKRERLEEQRFGEWVCRDEPAPPGRVITKGGSMGSCVGACASRYVERLRDHMIICAGQKVPEGYDLLGVTTVSDCDCIAGSENAMIIQLKPGYRIGRRGAIRDPHARESEDTFGDTDLTGE